MTYSDLIQFYFDRSSALQLYWTIYVVVIGGLLAFSSMRQRPAPVTLVLVTVLYACFAYKNLGAILDVSAERMAIRTAISEFTPTGTDLDNVVRTRELLEPALVPPPLEGIRTFHIVCDVLTVVALWAMEWRRRKG